jgi:hypothetical protein
LCERAVLLKDRDHLVDQRFELIVTGILARSCCNERMSLS